MIDQLEQLAAEYVNWTIESMVISGRAAYVDFINALSKDQRCTGFKDVKVMDLETFLEKRSASEARNVLPEVGFRWEQELMQTGNDEAPAQENSGPKIQLSKKPTL